MKKILFTLLTVIVACLTVTAQEVPNRSMASKATSNDPQAEEKSLKSLNA